MRISIKRFIALPSEKHKTVNTENESTKHLKHLKSSCSVMRMLTGCDLSEAIECLQKYDMNLEKAIDYYKRRYI